MRHTAPIRTAEKDSSLGAVVNLVSISRRSAHSQGTRPGLNATDGQCAGELHPASGAPCPCDKRDRCRLTVQPLLLIEAIAGTPGLKRPVLVPDDHTGSPPCRMETLPQADQRSVRAAIAGYRRPGKSLSNAMAKRGVSPPQVARSPSTAPNKDLGHAAHATRLSALTAVRADDPAEGTIRAHAEAVVTDRLRRRQDKPGDIVDHRGRGQSPAHTEREACLKRGPARKSRT